MKFVHCLSALILGLGCLEVNGRAVNISSVWFLPQEGFPVFYKYFKDKVTWNEAESFCGYHHADLLSVQTGNQMDVVRAYLKEMDVTDNVWIGLKKESSDRPCSWTNGEKLLGDGYWLEPIPKTNDKLCAAIDPVYDFRWKTHYCDGPQLASFVCEMPVPEWAKKDNGCMITSLPSLTVTFIPEMGIVQLLSDCGLDGTRRIACKGGVNRDDIIKRLSCDEDAFPTTLLGKLTTDAVKEANTQQNAKVNEIRMGARELTTQDLLKAWEANLPQTRHKRKTKMEPEPTVRAEQSEPSETSMESAGTTQRVSVLHVPSRVFPHSPAEKNSASTNASPLEDNVTKENTKEATMTPTEATDKKVAVETATNKFVLPPVLLSKFISVERGDIHEETTTKSTEKVLQNPEKLKETDRPTNPSISEEVPVLITETPVSNSAQMNASTSENPQLVATTDEGKEEGLQQSYLVPMGEDILKDHPSLSPMEVLDVDVFDLDNVTALKTTHPPTTVKAETTQSSPVTSRIAHGGLHPLRLGEKNDMVQNATAKTAATTVGTTSTSSPSTASTTITNLSATTTSVSKSSQTTTNPNYTRSAPAEKLQQMPQNTEERDNKGDSMDLPPRPNRGRLLTHSNHPSFYPYFLNRVLG